MLLPSSATTLRALTAERGDRAPARMSVDRCDPLMHDAQYYRYYAARARRLAHTVVGWRGREALRHFAKDYDEIAEDLEIGAIEIRHPEWLPQLRGKP